MVTSNQATTHPPTIRAVLTHKPEREELNLKPKPDPKSEEDCQTEPQTSTGEAEEGDGTFDPSLWSRRWTLMETWKNMNISVPSRRPR
jgi:hypothetical protein